MLRVVIAGLSVLHRFIMFCICLSVLTNQKRGAAAVNAIMLRKEPSSEMDLVLFFQKSKRFFEKRVDKKEKLPLVNRSKSALGEIQ